MCARSIPPFPDNRRQFCEGTEVALIPSLAEFTRSCICQTGSQIIVGKDPVARRLQTLRQPTQECHKFVKADMFFGGPPVRLPDVMDRQDLIAMVEPVRCGRLKVN